MSQRKLCVNCGAEFIDESRNRSRKYCSYECKYKTNFARRTYKPRYSDGWEIQPVCKTCKYRKGFHTGTYFRSDDTYWDDTYCSYLEQTGEQRGCEPKGNNCGKYKKREINYEL